MEAGHSHIVRPDGSQAELVEDRPRLLGQEDVARARRHERDRTRAKVDAERSGEPHETAVGPVLEPKTVAPGRPKRAQLPGGRSRDERALPPRPERPDDLEKMVDGLPFGEDDLGHSDPSGAVAIEPRDVSDR